MEKNNDNNDMKKNNDYVTKTEFKNQIDRLSNKIEGKFNEFFKWNLVVSLAMLGVFVAIAGILFGSMTIYQNARINDINTKIDAKFANIDSKFDSMDSKFDSMDSKIDNLRILFVGSRTSNGQNQNRDVDQVEGASGYNGLVYPPDDANETLKPVRLGQGKQSP